MQFNCLKLIVHGVLHPLPHRFHQPDPSESALPIGYQYDGDLFHLCRYLSRLLDCVYQCNEHTPAVPYPFFPCILLVDHSP